MRWRLVPWYILCFMLLSGTPGPVLAAVITVHNGENLQTAIDAASPGDTLRVEAGTYSGNFVVATPLTLQGTGSPVLDGENRLNRDTITLLADGIHLEGFVITHSAGAGINVSSRENVIRGNEVVFNGQFGILVRSGNNLIEENNCSETSGSLRNGIGIHLSSASGTRVINNTVLANGKNGLQISYSSSLLLEGNRISAIGGRSGGGHGIRLENSAFVVLCSNRIVDCLTDGLYLYNASHSTFQDLILDNTTTGITLRGTDNTTFDRVTVQNNQVGMDIMSSGLALPDRVFRSSFFSNTLPVTSTGSTVEWRSPLPLPYRYDGRYYENYTGNYWDTYPYGDGNDDGIGDRSYSVSSVDTDRYPLISFPADFEWDPDITPPGMVRNLTGSSPNPTTYCWTWQDPPDRDLDHLVIYLNGTLLKDLSPGVETITLDGLSPSTAYTLGIFTVDTSGNRNMNGTNDTGTTAALPDPSPSPTETANPTPSETVTPSITVTPSPTPLPTSVPSSREGTNRRNTRYIPPPSHDPLTATTPSPTAEEESPSLTSETAGTVPAPESTSTRSGASFPWTAEIPAPAAAVPLAALGFLGYRYLRKKR